MYTYLRDVISILIIKRPTVTFVYACFVELMLNPACLFQPGGRMVRIAFSVISSWKLYKKFTTLVDQKKLHYLL